MPFQCYVCRGLISWETQVERHAASHWSAAQIISLEHYQPQSLCIRWHFFSPTHLSDLQVPTTLLGPFFQSRCLPSFLPPFFSTTSLLVCRSYWFSAPTLSESLDCPPLPNSLSLNIWLNGWCSHVILTGRFKTCNLYLVMALSKFTIRPHNKCS